jgi:hypothetical protein
MSSSWPLLSICSMKSTISWSVSRENFTKSNQLGDLPRMERDNYPFRVIVSSKEGKEEKVESAAWFHAHIL